MNEPERRLAAGVLDSAIRDARGDRQTDRPHAVAWLASRRAERWLDILDIPQSSLLTHLPWRTWAQEVLPDAQPDEHACIQDSLTYLESL